MYKKISPKLISLSFGILVLTFAIGFYIFAWVEPTSLPPLETVPTPLNVSSDEQTKEGRLNINNSIVVSEQGSFANDTVVFDNPDAAREIGQIKLINKLSGRTAMLTAFTERPALELSGNVLGGFEVFSIETSLNPGQYDAMFEFWRDSFFIVGMPSDPVTGDIYDMRMLTQWDPFRNQATTLTFGVPQSGDVKGTYIPVLIIDEVGNVGIGTTNPDSAVKLDIQGGAKIDDFIFAPTGALNELGVYSPGDLINPVIIFDEGI